MCEAPVESNSGVAIDPCQSKAQFPLYRGGRLRSEASSRSCPSEQASLSPSESKVLQSRVKAYFTGSALIQQMPALVRLTTSDPQRLLCRVKLSCYAAGSMATPHCADFFLICPSVSAVCDYVVSNVGLGQSVAQGWNLRPETIERNKLRSWRSFKHRGECLPDSRPHIP